MKKEASDEFFWILVEVMLGQSRGDQNYEGHLTLACKGAQLLHSRQLGRLWLGQRGLVAAERVGALVPLVLELVGSCFRHF